MSYKASGEHFETGKDDSLEELQKVENFTVLMSVYHKEVPKYLFDSVLSVMSNTVLPNELIIVEDGPLTRELYLTIEKLQEQYPIVRTIKLKSNIGLAKALNVGIEAASNELIARMDTDDVCVKKRFEKQLNFLKSHNIDVCGGQIVEFDESMTNPIGMRVVPLDHDSIVKFARRRAPLNHMTVLYKKSVVQSVGGYRSVPFLEDYDLWVRLIIAGATFANLPDVLVHVRAGKGMLRRRGGWRYILAETKFFRELYQKGFISGFELASNISIRFVARLLPPFLRGIGYKMLRHKVGNL